MKLKLQLRLQHEDQEFFIPEEILSANEDRSVDLEGDSDTIRKQLIVLSYIVGCLATGDKKLPDIFARENVNILLPNPFYNI